MDPFTALSAMRLTPTNLTDKTAVTYMMKKERKWTWSGVYMQDKHVHFQEANLSELEEEKLDSTDSDDSYTVNLPRGRPHMAYLNLKCNNTINLDSVEKLATNVNKLITVVNIY